MLLLLSACFYDLILSHGVRSGFPRTMTSFRIQLPEKFDISRQEEWPKWSRRFERFRQASGLLKEEEESQINMLIYAMGDQADDILNSFKLSTTQLKQYHTVKTKFDEHFVVRRNVIFERAKFNQRRQEEGETVDTFITALHALAQNCNFGTLTEEMIRDRIVVGLLDAKLSEKLQLNPELTLPKAVNQARQSEAVKKQQTLMRNDFKDSTGTKNEVDAVKTEKFRKDDSSGSPDETPNSKKPPTRPPSNRCYRCGKSSGHVRQNCPAKAVICHTCSKKGHWASVCKSSQTVGEIEEDYAFLGAIGTERNEDIWSVDLTLNNSLVHFKIDTGADVTVIPESVYKKLKPTPTLIRSSKSLFGPVHTTLPVLGCFMGVIKRGEESSSQEIFAVNGARLALLGRPAIETLKIVQTVNAVKAEEVKEKFPNLFKGLGKLDGPDYVIKLKLDAKPHAISTPRRVPVPLLSKVKEELSRMEQMEIISKVPDEPTEWFAWMVVVPKANGKVRICVDLTKVNESILREYHPLPSVDHALAQLAGATIFSKRDANSGFWQIGLSPESAKLTTFITPFGRFCFNRLPFGISSAPEHFQKRISQVVERTDGALCLMDDILVYGKSVGEHNQHLEATVHKLQEANLTLNEEKCDFSKPSVEFLGTLIDSEVVHVSPKKVEAILKMKTPQDQTELRRFLGMVNQLSKFRPRIAELSKPLRDLLSSKSHWLWSDAQQQAFTAMKESLASTPTLAHYDATRQTKLSSDASSHGLGAVLM